MGFKKELIVFLFILFYISSVVAVTVVESTTPPPEKKESHWYSFLGSIWFWIIFLGIIFFILACVGIFFIIKWIAKLIKKRSDVFYRIREERIYMAKLQSRYHSNHWFKVHKNTPIRLVRFQNGKPYISEPIAYHRGDFSNQEGNISIALNLSGDKHYFIYPRTSLLVIPNRASIDYTLKKKDGTSDLKTMNGIPTAEKIVQFNPTEILIYAESFTQVGYFLFPVLKSADGKIVDLSIPVYSTLKDVAMNELMYEQIADFGILSKKAMELNPHVRSISKLQDSNTNVEIPSNEN